MKTKYVVISLLLHGLVIVAASGMVLRGWF